MNAKLVLLAAISCTVLSALAQETVLKNDQVTEAALTDALTGNEPASTTRTRGFRPAPAGSAAPER